MRISYSTVPMRHLYTGYGYAGLSFVRALQAEGHQVLYDSPDLPVHINFCTPNWYKIRDSQYTVGYTPWESTELPDEYVEIMNQCDEIWATSRWLKTVYDRILDVPVRVVPHGINPIWETRMRKRKVHSSEPFKFLHMGSPAPRKGTEDVYKIFKSSGLTRNPGVSLTFKSKGPLPFEIEEEHSKNIHVITDTISEQEIVELFYDHHAFVYPSYGEGFGLNPFHAAATGMPTLVTGEWCDYYSFVHKPVGSTEIPSPWPEKDPGNVYKPYYREISRWLKDVRVRYKEAAVQQYLLGKKIHKHYAWSKIIENALSGLPFNP